MQDDREATVWVDVEDFFRYFTFNPRPSGIQRLAFETKRALLQVAGGQAAIRFVRHGAPGSLSLQEVPWHAVQALFEAPPNAPSPRERPPLRARRPPEGIAERLPQELREPLQRASLLQREVGNNVRELLHLFRPPAPVVLREAVSAPVPLPALAMDAFAAAVRPGDHLLALGAPWSVPDFPALAAGLKRRRGMRLTVLFHDLIPARHPEWHAPDSVALFEEWLQATLPLCDGLLAVSRYTAGEVTAYAQEHGIALAAPVGTIPVGTAFDLPALGAARPFGLPQPGSYVLFVSTLEARKNHALAVRIWRKLEDEARAGTRAPDSVPELVFAGRVGGQVADLMQQLENMAWLGGRIRLIRDPSDAELRALYEGCLFTLFPSLVEGWGLPVSESLALGKPCLCSSATALPEAGGALGRYFDPDSLTDAHRAVATLLDDPDGIAQWQDQVRRDFRPTPWAETARALLQRLPGGATP